jgi:LacI family kdg operon repressor
MNRFNQNNVTISQVAAAAQVSMTTISRYLNGKYEYMSAETKQRIAGVIEKMDYHPSNIARSLKARTSRSVGCVIADIGSQFSSILLKGVDEVCSAEGYQVLFSDAANNPQKERNTIQELLNSRVDGLIVNTTGCNDDYLVGLKERGVPIVLADRCLAHSGVLDTVTAENYRATYACMRHLYENGYSRVAFFAPDIGCISPRVERHRAFQDAMRELYCLDGSALTFETGGDSPEASAKMLERFLTAYPGERLAVLCVNGVTLIHALQAMRLLHRRIDENLGICGFDDWEWAELIPPGITTIAKDSHEIGMKAAELLIRRITGKRTSKPVFLELESSLRIRGSTDPALAAQFYRQ